MPLPSPPSSSGVLAPAPTGAAGLTPLRRQTLLADVSLLLASAPSLEAALEPVARRVVMEWVDWCAVDVLAPEDGWLSRVTLAGAPHVEAGARSVLASSAPPLVEAPAAPGRVLRQGQPELASPVGEAELRGLAGSALQLDVLRQLALGETLCAPLMARGRSWGVLWLACSRGSGRHLGAADVAFAEELAQRVALRVEQEARQKQVLEEVQLGRALLEHCPVGMAVVDRGLHVVHMNHALGAWWGLSGRWTERSLSELAPALVEPVERVLSTGQPESGIPLAQVVDGGPFAAPEALLTLYPLPGEDGRPAAVGMVVSAVPATPETHPDVERYRLLARATNDVIWDWDLSSGRLEWNPALHTVFGYPADPAQAELEWWSDHVHPEDRERAVSSLHEVVDKGEECWACEYRFRRADGSYAVVLDRAYAARDAEGRVVRMMGTMLDITERTRRAEEREALVGALEQQHQRLETVLEQLPIGVLIAEAPSGRILTGNRQLTELLGAAVEHMPSVAHQGAWRGFHGDGRPYESEEWPLARAVRRGETVASEQIDVLREDGVLVATQMCAAPLRDATGALIGGVVTVTDVSERRAAEKERLELLARAEVARAESESQRQRLEGIAAQRESHERWLEAVLDHAPLPLVLLEVETAEVRFSNRAAEGFGGGEALVRGAVEVSRAPDGCESFSTAQIPFDQLPAVRAARGSPLQGALLRWSNGQNDYTLLAHATQIPASAGWPAAVLLALQDVTPLQQAEERQLQAVRARDVFLAVAAHELRTPMTALKLSTQRLASASRTLAPQGSGPLLAGPLESVERQVRRLERLIAHLFDVTQLDRGPLPLELGDVDLSRLAHEAAARFSEEATRAGCTLTVSAPWPALGRWDRARLEQVLDNLVSNALRYGAGQPVSIVVETEGDVARFTVADHGIGIPVEAQSRIFERFERAVSERHYGGLGLGLWVARQILQAHGGSISVHSSPGAGATFTFSLPRGGPEHAAPPLVTTPES